jgi:hypothetical protein
MIVNAAFVRQLYPGRDVIGLPLALTFRFPMGDYSFGTHTVVGVVSDALHDSLRDPIRPMIYVPLAQREPIPQNDFYLAVRSTGGSPELLERSVATAIDRFHADLTFLFEPLRRVVDESIAQERVVALLASLFGALALLLAAIGLYGVTSYDVERHRPELGIRLALGARPNGVLRLVLSRVVVFVGAGIAIGAVLSAWASRFTASLLFEISPRDPVAFTTAAAALAVVAVMAAFVPAYRASRIDPAEVLRES